MRPLVWTVTQNSCYTETIDESKMASESLKTNLQAGENEWLMPDTDAQENWKKDVKEIISSCMM